MSGRFVDPIGPPPTGVEKFKRHLRDEHRTKHGVDYSLLTKYEEIVLTGLYTIHVLTLVDHLDILREEFPEREIKVIDAETGNMQEFKSGKEKHGQY